MMTSIHIRRAVLSCTLAMLLTGASASAVTLEWAKQLASDANYHGYYVATDGSGNVYFAGQERFNADFDGDPDSSYDALLVSYDQHGKLRWGVEHNPHNLDYVNAHGVGADPLGNVTLVGYSSVSWPVSREPNVHLAKYDTSGSLIWVREQGSSAEDNTRGGTVDAHGNVYAVGWTLGNLWGSNAGGSDAFVMKYSDNGAHQWTRQFVGVDSDHALDAAIDNLGNVFVSGRTQSSLAGENAGRGDAFVAKFDSLGVPLWTRQWGTTANESARALAVDGAGGVYVAGGSSEDEIGFLTRLDSNGSVQWTRELDVAGEELVTDELGRIYIGANTTKSLAGDNAGGRDVLLSSFGSDGSPLWSKQFGSPAGDWVGGIALDGSGAIYVSGRTGGDLFSIHSGLAPYEPFLAKFNNIFVPEPGALTLVAVTVVALHLHRRPGGGLPKT